ncbi:hypothetical protein [Luteimonas terricola]|uniref:Uncharacterized protein n=1 Tax=Luteimonas terricola TaxID=645597 RepID=A0ABQ2EEF9_9GAMM|nr:hypothetical protein [Luteimonas terricola]GGK08733.1 hypothetical protein GCM10011394_17660 [Luteimonas terricola]
MTTPEPSKDLYLRVRAGFVLQGTTLQTWCRQNGTHSSNAQRALIGSWDGPKARELRSRVIKAAHIEEIRP